MTTVKDIMTKTVLTAHIDTPFYEVVQTLMKSNISHLPITNTDGSIRGILSASDVLEALHELDQFAINYKGFSLEKQLSVRDEMSSDVQFIKSSTGMKKAVEIMVDNDIHALPIVDHGEIVGILTSNDILRAIQKGKFKM